MNNDLFPGEQQLCTAKILVIDDEDGDIRALEWVCRMAKFANFRSVTDSARALEVFKEFQPDLVLLDLHMPEPDGFAVLKQIRETVPAGDFLPVLVLTGQDTVEMRRQVMTAGANDFLGKPVDYTEVTLRMRNLLQTRFLHQQTQEMQARLKALMAAEETDAQTKPRQKP
jgi:putative two-component system response regulator